ncbi:MAG: glycosyltransferase family protein [Candidatus Methylomirabilis sp.]
MPTFSAFARHAYRTGLREAQDVLASCDDVDLIALEAGGNLTGRERFLSRLVYHDLSRRVAFMNPGIRPVRLNRDYDLFVLVCPWWRDVWYANAILGWQDRCRTSVCWIDEMWVEDVTQLRYWLPVLSRFDHVVVGIGGTGKVLADAIGRPCHETTGGVDAIRFSPYPDQPARTIDVLSIGRRKEGMHKAFLELSAAKDFFYVHDTIQSGDSQAPDHREHRDMYARTAKRSKFFVVAPGKMNVLQQTGGQVDIGFRYYEGAAAGAVMLGQVPQSESFKRHFEWPDAVTEVQPDGSDTAAVIASLRDQPGRLAQISRRNAQEALLRHDWVYRWRDILRIAGLEPTASMDARMTRLKDLAMLARDSRSAAP